MDYLDPRKERFNNTMLLIGYGLVALAIGIATLILLYLSYGYGINKKGQVIQKGLVFFSSQPTGATIFLNGQQYGSKTNARAVIPAGSYSVKIQAPGYRDWQRQIVVAGGDVQHYDYPFLFPQQIKTAALRSVDAAPTLLTQSPDKRWLLIGQPGNLGSFGLYDLGDPTKPVRTEFSLPDGVITPGDGAQSWNLIEWSTDNRHVLLKHGYTTNQAAATEYILLDRNDPTASVNLTTSLGLTADETPALFNKGVDQFYVYNQANKTLRRVTAANQPVSDGNLEHVLAYKPYGTNRILYVTDHAPTGKLVAGQVSVVLQVGQKTYTLRTLPAGAGAYSLDEAQYSGDWYVVAAADNDTAAYVYKNPESSAQHTADGFPLAWRRLSVPHTNYVSFSSSAQFIVAESGQQFGVYDAENIGQYSYQTLQPLDQPQAHASWMDGDRLQYVSGGKLLIFDYDYRNPQQLEPNASAYLPAFAPNYRYVFSVAPGDNGAYTVTSTPLVTNP